MNIDEELRRGRDCHARSAWADAYEALSRADRLQPLATEDLERLALSAYLIQRTEEYLQILERTHHAHLAAGERTRAARCAFWIGLQRAFRGEMGPASGWFARAERLLPKRECVEQGYLLLPVIEQRLGDGDWVAAQDDARRAADIGARHADTDLIACARHLLGRALLGRGDVAAGVVLLDEAMVAVTTGEVSPLVTGLIYCSVIDACQRACLFPRAREWTAALVRWCEAQPQLVAFTNRCLVHRAEIMQLSGAWAEADEEARRVCERCAEAEQQTAAAAFYQLGELHRLAGRSAAAEEAYVRASRLGREPQPGLALLRLAQGRGEAAVAAIRRAVDGMDGAGQPGPRAELLRAHVEIALDVGERDEARAACADLERIAARHGTEMLEAMAAHARGAIELAEQRARAAAATLRRAFERWQRIGAPYEAARARWLLGHACQAAGDAEGAALELDAARTVFARLGAASDLARTDASPQRAGVIRETHKLTPRELQVLRLIASGKTNRDIAAELFVSEKTVDRHVSNIFQKLDVPSRTAATAYAYRHSLV